MLKATIEAPVKGKMLKGLCLCYALVIATFFSVAISGYWVFGNAAESTIIYNFMTGEDPLLPTCSLLLINVFTLFQVAAVGVIYLQPTNEALESKFGDPNMGQFSARNVVPRLVLRSLAVAVAALFAAMFPFFGDLNAVIGAFGFIPVDFVLPMLFYNVTFNPAKTTFIFWINIFIALTFSVVGLLGAIASVRQIVIDSNTYHLFANL